MSSLYPYQSIKMIKFEQQCKCKASYVQHMENMEEYHLRFQENKELFSYTLIV